MTAAVMEDSVQSHPMHTRLQYLIPCSKWEKKSQHPAGEPPQCSRVRAASAGTCVLCKAGSCLWAVHPGGHWGEGLGGC